MINISEKAQAEIRRLMGQSAPGSFLRMGVKTGGCSGLTYDVKFDDKQDASDREYEANGLKVVCDLKSMLYLDGMTVDFSADLVGGGFKFLNPNATGSCGCGTSFTVKKGKLSSSEPMDSASPCSTPAKEKGH